MRVGIIGSGRIGGNIGRFLAGAGHDVVFSWSRDPDKLQELAREAGERARAGSVTEAADCEVVVLSVPWALVDDALAAAGGLDGRIVIDTCNQFAGGGRVTLPEGMSAAQVNAARAPGARWNKAFNTLTSRFQAQTSGRTGRDRVVMFHAGDDPEAKQVVARLIDDAGFAPVDMGSLALDDVGHMEPKGELYGEDFYLPQAEEIAARLRGTPPAGTGRG